MPKSDRRIYLNADKSKVVPEDSPEATFLFVSAGKEVSKEDMERYGLTFGEDKAETKAQKPVENKAETPDENKAEESADDDKPAPRTRRVAS